MPLKDYARLNPNEVVVAEFQENVLAGRRFRVVLVGGETAEGIPTASQGNHLDFRIRTGNGQVLKIPFADVVSAQPFELDDRHFMGVAIKESRKCRPEAGRQSPVPKVGAVIVVNGVLAGTAYRNEIVLGGKDDEGDHAEMTLLEKKLKDAENIAGATLYTTLEPCCSERRHPNRPCTTHIIARRVRRVVIGILDPNQAICGKGVWRLREAGVDVSLCDADLTREIEDVNREFIWEYRGRT